jgi:hypothetical protein
VVCHRIEGNEVWDIGVVNENAIALFNASYQFHQIQRVKTKVGLEQGIRWPTLGQAWLNPEKVIPDLDDHAVELRPGLRIDLTEIHGYTGTALARRNAAGGVASGARGSPMRR